MVNSFLIALGSNLPSPAGEGDAALTFALRLLDGEGMRLACQSRLYSTPAYPSGSGPDFVNAVAQVSTLLAPDQVLKRLHEIEKSLGRERSKRWAPRIIDLDLLAYGDVVLPNRKVFLHWNDLSFDDQKIRTPDELIVPHPRLHERAFVLVPMLDVAPDWRHPVLGKTVRAMVDDLPCGEVGKIGLITGDPGL